ncbi:MAG TPA: hypothetical protein VGX28_09905 [Frankiaceae bacterium]|jgi:hypothetical protein|nr:hypothetical protein [Frankiaceae bacterium]
MLAALAAGVVTYLAVVAGPPPASTDVAAVVMPTCAADVWLTLGAGEKATVPSCTAPAVTASGRGAVVEGWEALRRRNDGAPLGALVEALRREGDCVGADGPLAALAAADATGRVAEYRAAAPTCAVQLVETVPSATTATVLALRVPRRLHLGALVTETVRPLTYRGTPKRPGLLTLPDVTRLLAPVGVGVRPYGTDGGDPADLDRLANARQRWNGFFVAGLISFPLLLLIALWARRAVPSWLGVAVASYAPAGFVVGVLPWWRWGPLGAALALLAVALALTGLAYVLARRAPELGLCAVVAAAFGVDLLGGQAMQRNGLASYSMLTGGRFYGLGNLGFAVLATAVVVLAGSRRDPRAWLAALVPLALLDATVGYDFGGVVAVAAAGAAAFTRRLRAVLVAAVLGLVAALGVAYADSLRHEPTHLGRLFTDGDAAATIARKGGSALHTVYATAWPLLVVGCAVGAWYLLRDRRELHDSARVVAVLLVVGSAVNDSGIVVAGGGLALATPLLVSYARRA